MTNQSQIDALTERLKKGNEDLSAELKNESAEIQAAIGSSKINTSEFEAEIAKTEGLRVDVKNLFTAEASASEEPAINDQTDQAPADQPPQPDQTAPDQAPATDAPQTDQPADDQTANEAPSNDSAANEPSTDASS